MLKIIRDKWDRNKDKLQETLIKGNTFNECSYGSCSGCDTLQSIQDYSKRFLTDQQVSDFMTLCKDILTNTIKPYNSGWRENPDYEQLN